MSTKPEYPGKLYHGVPSWVPSGSLYHVRIRLPASSTQNITAPELARPLIDSAQLYHDTARWHARIFLLMPDHVHALLSFPEDKSMSHVIGAWKGFHAKRLDISWQRGYFDHRLRHDEAVDQKAHYIRMNPVRQKLCRKSDDWPWAIEPYKG